MPRVGLSTDAVVAVAAQMLDEVAATPLTLAGLAARLGVRQPSLYKHIGGQDDLYRRVTIVAKRELGRVWGRAAVGVAGQDALVAMAYAYRGWALEHPGLYQLVQRAPTAGDVDDETATAQTLEVLATVMGHYGLGGDDAVDAMRAFRAALHGFVQLEAAGSFTLATGVDRSFARLVATFVAALPTWGHAATAVGETL